MPELNASSGVSVSKSAVTLKSSSAAVSFEICGCELELFSCPAWAAAFSASFSFILSSSGPVSKTPPSINSSREISSSTLEPGESEALSSECGLFSGSSPAKSSAESASPELSEAEISEGSSITSKSEKSGKSVSKLKASSGLTEVSEESTVFGGVFTQTP